MLPRLLLDTAEREEACTILEGFLLDESKIVQVNAIQALADLASEDTSRRERVIALVERLIKVGSPAVKARGQRLLEKLNAEDVA